MDITVVIPTYNRFEVLKRALTSVYLQSYKPAEVIIVDDGSTDDTKKIKDLFPHAQYIYQENSGVSSARNTGIKNSTCRHIAFLDSDDTWHVEKLARHVEFHKDNPEILMSYTDERWIRNTLEVKMPGKFQKYGGDIFKECLSHCIIAPSAVLIHKKLLEKVGLFDESLEVCEDYDLWLRVACANEIGLIDQKLITKYGGAQDQLSMKHWGMDRFRVLALEKLLLFENKQELVLATLLKKYKLLLKGAVKHNKTLEIREYEKKIKKYSIS
ncbi:glycosyltransferase family 2 protein [bacterium]|nr:glycosyltransferase family 2 protein [bacterium]MBU1990194.1 glycosyltransferase family 2 protein [bacterium]